MNSYHEAPLTSLENSDRTDSQDSSSSWQFTDFGQVGEFSRDGSIHATDEVINSASHLAASLLSFLGTVLLISRSAEQGSPWKIVSFAIYGLSLIFLFVCSTLHHAITSSPKFENTLRMLDYLAIYPLIAGTFTPLCLVFYHDSVIGWSFCSVVWAVAIGGMIMTANIFNKIPTWLSMTLYITLGWLGAFMSYWLYQVVGVGGMALFVGGGLFYTVGGYIYMSETPAVIIPGRFGFHELWHFFVIGGAACHFILMYSFVLPYNYEPI